GRVRRVLSGHRRGRRGSFSDRPAWPWSGLVPSPVGAFGRGTRTTVRSRRGPGLRRDLVPSGSGASTVLCSRMLSSSAFIPSGQGASRKGAGAARGGYLDLKI